MMRTKTWLVMSVMSTLLIAVNSNASDAVADVSAGSTGLGLHASIPFDTNINLRFGVNYMKLSTIMKDTDGDTNVNITLNTLDALVDWFPLESGFHVTGGLVYNGNKIDTVTQLNGVTYKGNTLTPLYGKLGQVDGNFKVGNVISPYIGIGWGNVLKQSAGWGFTTDIGLLFHGKPQVTLNNAGCTADAVTCTAIAIKVADEEARLNDEYSSKVIYPVARAGVSYKF